MASPAGGADAPLNILVMTADWQSGLACIQSLGRKGHAIFALSASRDSPNLRSSLVRKVIASPEGSEDQVVAALFEIVEQHAIDVVIPVSDYDAQLAAIAKERGPRGERFVVGSRHAVALARSRNATVELCRKLGIRTPRTEFVTPADAHAACARIGYPCFLKASGTVASGGVFRVTGEAELNDALAKAGPRAELQVQEEITGHFADITAFCREGAVLAEFSFRSPYDLSRGGTPAHSEYVDDPKLSEILAVIVKELDWHGGIDLDLLGTPDGDYVMLEINPRLSGTAVFALKRGVDLPAGYLGRDPAIPLECPAEAPNATGYISMGEEMDFLCHAGAAAKRRILAFRQSQPCTHNAFWDDPGYSRALFASLYWRWFNRLR